jgi:hypothetical protein
MVNYEERDEAFMRNGVCMGWGVELMLQDESKQRGNERY